MRLEASNRAIWLVMLLSITAGITLFGLANAEVRWPDDLSDTISEGLLMVAVFVWLWMAVRRSGRPRPITVPLLLGGGLLFLGTVSDVLGDFFFHLPKLIRGYHYLANGLILAGAVLITVGLTRWGAYTRRGAETIARLHEETRHHVDYLSTLREIDRQLTSSLNLDKILDFISAEIVRLTGARRSLILLTDHERRQVTVSAGHGYSAEELAGLSFQEFEDGLSGWVAQEKQPALSPDIQADVRCVGLAQDKARAFGTKSMAVAPLLINGRVMGTLSAVNTRDDRTFTQADLGLVSMLAGQAAIAIENAWLFESERKKATELEAVNQVARRIVSILDLDKLLSEVTSLISQTFDYYHVAIMLVDPTSDDLVFKVAAGGYKGKTLPGMRQKKKEGLIGWAAYLGETILANDVSLDPRFIPAYLPETKSELDIPLKIGDQVIGVLDVQSKELNAFTEDDKRILETLANQIAVAIENAQLYEEQKAQNDRISALYRIDQALISSIDLEQTLQLVMKEISAAIGVNRCSLWLLDESGQSVVGTADLQPGTGKTPSIIGMKLRLSDEPLLEKVLTEGQPIFVNDVHDPAWTHLTNKEYIETIRLQSFLVVPLESKGQRKGFIVLDDSREHHLFTPGEVALAVSAARQASIAIENARLFEETKQRLQELAMLYQVGVGIIGTLKLNHVLQLIIDSAVRAIPVAEKGSLFLLDEESNELVIRAAHGYSPEVVEKVRLKVGEGYTGWLVEERMPVVIDNFQTDSRVEDFSDLEEVAAIKSAVFVPLEVKGRVIGALTLDNITSYSAFSKSDPQLLSTFASQAAIAIENARLYEEIRAFSEELEQRVEERTRELTTLHTIAATVSQSLDLEAIARGALEQVLTLMQRQSGGFYLVDEEREELHLVAHQGLSDEFVQAVACFRLGQGLIGTVASTGEPIVLEDISADPHLMWVKEVKGVGMRPFAGVPLRAAGRVVGVMVISSFEERPFSEDEVSLLTAIGNQIGVAVENARLYEEAVQTQERLDTIFRSVADGLIVTDVQGRVTLVNAVTEQLLGIPLERLQGKMLSEAAGEANSNLARLAFMFDSWPEGKPTLELELPRLDQTVEPKCCARFDCGREDCPVYFDEDTRCWLRLGTLCRDGHPHTLEGEAASYCFSCELYRDLEMMTLEARAAQIVGEDGVMRGTVTVLRDVTPFKELGRMKDELINTVSHELRTPMASVLGFSELLLTRQLSGEKRLLYTETIYKEAQRLSALINDFLDIQRMEAGRQEYHMEPLALPEVITAVQATFATQSEKHSIVVDIPEELPLVRADRAAVTRVLNNLLSNAIKFSPQGGEIRVSCAAIEVEGETATFLAPEVYPLSPAQVGEGRWVVVKVADEGLGIPAEAMLHLFEKFYRVDSPDRREIKGTGLGLAICKEIVAAHGGRIWAEREYGSGSTFSFALPMEVSS